MICDLVRATIAFYVALCFFGVTIWLVEQILRWITQ